MQAIGYHVSTFCVKVFSRSTCRGMKIYGPVFLLFLEFNIAKEKKEEFVPSTYTYIPYLFSFCWGHNPISMV